MCVYVCLYVCMHAQKGRGAACVERNGSKWKAPGVHHAVIPMFLWVWMCSQKKKAVIVHMGMGAGSENILSLPDREEESQSPFMECVWFCWHLPMPLASFVLPWFFSFIFFSFWLILFWKQSNMTFIWFHSENDTIYKGSWLCCQFPHSVPWHPSERLLDLFFRLFSPCLLLQTCVLIPCPSFFHKREYIESTSESPRILKSRMHLFQ